MYYDICYIYIYIYIYMYKLHIYVCVIIRGIIIELFAYFLNRLDTYNTNITTSVNELKII